MLYDIKRVIDGGETNYVSATLAIYLDIYNVFQSLLMLLVSSAAIASNRASLRRSQQGPAVRGLVLFIAVEHRDAFDVCGVREHVRPRRPPRTA
jgi:hypothetical protein